MSARSVSDVSILLVNAIRAGDLMTIRALLLPKKNQGGRRATANNIKDKDIDEALCAAADIGCVESGRLLWQRLSRGGKKKYFAVQRSQHHNLPIQIAVFYGRLDVLRLFIEEFKWNINKKDCNDEPPLYYARNDEMARFLLEHGADPNRGGLYGDLEYGPLYFAINREDREVVQRLLLHSADPNLNRRSAMEEQETATWNSQHRRCTDIAIQHGSIEILRMLLQYGAFVGHCCYSNHVGSSTTSLNTLLRSTDIPRETKLTICRILVEHHHAATRTATTGNVDTARFLEMTFENAILETGWRILVEAGMEILNHHPASHRRAMRIAIRVGKIAVCQFLVSRFPHLDPFAQQQNDEDEQENEYDDEFWNGIPPPSSLFHAAAREPDTRIFEYFLELWDARFSSSTGGGKNGDGDYPIHVICCDSHISLQSVHVLVKRQADALAVVDGEQRLLPFHFAAMWNASLDVIFYLLQHCPDALRHVGVPAQNNNMVVETSNDHTAVHSNHEGQDDTLACGPVKKKAKTTH